jgi:hypothetical protein
VICVETARTDTVLPWWVPDNNIRLRGTGYGTSIDENKPMRVSSSDSPRSLEFRVDGGQSGHYTGFGVTVAVGTVIADRPPHRSVRARLRIRLLRRMSGVEASIRIGMQDAGRWNPPCQDWSNSLPSHLCALTAADQNIPPQPVDATFEDA